MSAFALAPDLSDALSKTYITNQPVDHIDRIDELQKFLLGSDWRSLASLDLSASPTKSTFEPVALPPFIRSGVQSDTSPAGLNNNNNMTEAPLFSTSAETVKPVRDMVSSAPASDAPLTPPLRSPFEVCYSDSAGSPDSSRDFLTSPSLFDDADFEFETDNLANNFSLFPDQSFEDDMSRAASAEPMSSLAATSSAAASVDACQSFGLASVKIEDSDSQQTELPWYASQSTVMASQPKHEEVDNASFCPVKSSLEAAFTRAREQAEADARTPEYNDFAPSDLVPYYGDDSSRPTSSVSTLAMAFGPVEDITIPIGHSSGPSMTLEPVHDSLESHAGPVRTAKSIRQRRASPVKTQPQLPARGTSMTISPAPVAHPTDKTKRWQCQDCGKWFDRAYNLKTHMFTHEDPEKREKPFICPDGDCQKPFARKHDMKRHFDNVHMGESRKVKHPSSSRNGNADDLG
ncbi:hypothetical protein BCV70DRAFT_199872 [Testicularia cyperi]|uniref:C2H2-type domain-containing protein n=1 Tax=Testicularia cyperi TaxID=1882483 RepID=A0A317XRU6_9BASI|nr:hypothetical protein BCV70DRAFT_199872 [Testicularia cyperi]